MDDLYETRDVDFDLKPSRNGRNLHGYVAVFNTRTRIPDRNGDFDEELKPGFADRSLRELGMPVMQWDHGRDTRVGTVPIGVWTEWKADGKGYQVRGHLIDDPVIEPVRKAIAEGAVTGLSFRFKVAKNGDKWERRGGGVDLRHVIDADVHEAGPVTFPAYRDAKVSIRDRGGLSVVERTFDDAEDRTVWAYALTWAGITEQRSDSGEAVRLRTHRRALDEWLAEWRADGQPPWPILRDHDPNQVVGHLVDAYADHHGLMTMAVYDDTAEGRQALRDIGDGTLTGYSVQLRVLDSVDDGDLVEVRSAVMVECGPTDRPFDRGAYIESAGGDMVETRAGFGSVDEFIDFARIRTGVDTAAAVESMRREERDAARAVEWKVAAADALTVEIAKYQQIVRDEHRAAIAYRRPGAFDCGMDADHDLVDLEAELRDVLSDDSTLIAQRLRAAGADPYFRSPFRSARAALASVVGGSNGKEL